MILMEQHFDNGDYFPIAIFDSIGDASKYLIRYLNCVSITYQKETPPGREVNILSAYYSDGSTDTEKYKFTYVPYMDLSNED